MASYRDNNETAISHIRGLDGLRGIAISLVVIHHFGTFAFADKEWPIGQLIERAVYIGWAGVDLFFVLSGFLITSILFSSRANSRYFSIFYSRRVLRIFPIYFAVLIVSLILLPQWSTEIAQKLLGESLANQLWLWTYTSNIALACGFVASFGMLDQFWTLAIEEQFYLIWPFLVRYISPKRLIGLCILIIIGALLLRIIWMANGGTWIGAYRFTLTRFDGLAFGAALAVWHQLNDRPWQFLLRINRWVMTGSAIIVLMMFIALDRFYPAATIVVTIGHTLFGLLFGSVLVEAVAGRNSRLQKLIEIDPLRSLGKYSYGIYVFHYPLLLIMARFDGLRVLGDSAGLSSHSFAWAFFLIGISGSIIAGIASYHLFEKHFLRLKRFVSYGKKPPESLEHDPRLDWRVRTDPRAPTSKRP